MNCNRKGKTLNDMSKLQAFQRFMQKYEKKNIFTV